MTGVLGLHQAFSDGGQKFCTVDWLGQIAVAAGGEALFIIAEHGIGRQGEDGARVAGVAEAPRCLVTVHDGHLHVHEDDVERFARRCGRQGFFAGNLAVFGHVDLGARLFQQE